MAVRYLTVRLPLCHDLLHDDVALKTSEMSHTSRRPGGRTVWDERTGLLSF